VTTRGALAVHGAYFTLTGVAPFLSRRAFEAVTGPKREWWLVQTVGALVTVAGAATLAASAREDPPPEAIGLAAGSALSLGVIDVVYVLRGRIRPTYLLDAAVEAALLAALVNGRRGS
jgi:hypothetical protein